MKASDFNNRIHSHRYTKPPHSIWSETTAETIADGRIPETTSPDTVRLFRRKVLPWRVLTARQTETDRAHHQTENVGMTAGEKDHHSEVHPEEAVAADEVGHRTVQTATEISSEADRDRAHLHPRRGDQATELHQHGKR